MGEQVVARSKKKGLAFLPGLQLSWLERTPDKREVGGSSPLKPIGVEAQRGMRNNAFRNGVAQSCAGTLLGPNEIHL